MPLTAKGEEILGALEREYKSKEKAERILYSMRSAGKLTGIDEEPDTTPPPPIEPSYVTASGILFVSEDGHALLMHRTDGTGWAFPGGRIEDGESPEDAARRETLEETGLDYKGPLRLHTRRIDDRADFTTYIALGVPKFVPEMNAEHDGFQWVDRKAALGAMQLHPGVPVALARPDMTELDVAKAIAAGELTSPQLFGNVLLVAMRVTGTGCAHRTGPANEPMPEFVYRDPDLYLNPEFLERVAGLFVVVDHTEGDESGRMTSEEYRAQNVGAAFYPYIKGDEVWCIAKIIDEAACRMLLEQQLSTSPAVIFQSSDGGEELTLPDGAKLLIEVKPRQLDHLAICRRGVWDKGGSPAGVDTSGVVTMAGEADEKAKKDAEEKAKQDAMFKRMDAACSKMDAVASEWQARKDAEEQAKKDAEMKAKKDAEDEKTAAEAKAKKDSEDEEEAKKEKAKKDAEEAAVAKAAKDAAASGDVASLRAELAAVRSTLPAKLTVEDRAKYSAVQMEAERVAQAFGIHDGAPGPMMDESLTDYRVRLLSKYKAHSPAWKEVNLSVIAHDGPAFAVAETQIYKDAYHVASNPRNEPGAPLTARTRTDSSGRRITSFSGDPIEGWKPFVGNGVRYLIGINRHPGS